MHVGDRSHARGWGEPRLYASALQLTFLFGTVIGSLALIANWNGSPDPLAEWLCGISARLLILVTLVKPRR